MKMYQVYVCDFCGRESRSHDEIELCEAKHMGLQSIEVRHEYDALKAATAYFASVVSRTNNERTRAAYDKAVEKQLAFESEHSIS